MTGSAEEEEESGRHREETWDVELGRGGGDDDTEEEGV
jgi:hypothetical protein